MLEEYVRRTENGFVMRGEFLLSKGSEHGVEAPIQRFGL